MSADFRVRFRNRLGHTSGDWTNFPTEVRARTFAAQALLNDPTIYAVELKISERGKSDER